MQHIIDTLYMTLTECESEREKFKDRILCLGRRRSMMNLPWDDILENFQEKIKKDT